MRGQTPLSKGRAGLIDSHHPPVLRGIALLCLSTCLSTPLLRGDHIVTVAGLNGRQVYVNTGNDAAATHTPTAAEALPHQSLRRLIRRTAGKYQVDPKLVDAMIKVESQYNPRAVSPKGALGLMQLIPATAERFGVQNPFDPRQNVQGGAAYLHYLLNLFNGNLRLSLAAYNAGEYAVLRDGDVPEIPETINYVRKVTALYGSRQPSAKNDPRATEVQPAPIYLYVDGRGVTHFTNGY